MNLEKEYICKEGFLMVNGAQNHNQSLVAIASRGLQYMLHFREKP